MIMDTKLVSIFNKKLEKINENRNIINKIKDINRRNIFTKINDFSKIHKNHLVTIKYKDTLNVKLLFTNIKNEKTKESVNKIFCIVNDTDVYNILLKVDNRLFNNDTILSGIVRKKNNSYILYIDDIIVYNGRFYKNHLGVKLMEINNILKNKYTYDPYMNPFYITIRPFFTIDNLLSLEYSTEDNIDVLFYNDNCNDNNIYIMNVTKNKKIENNLNEEESKETEIFKVIKEENVSEVYKLYSIYDNKFVDLLDIFSYQNSKFVEKENINGKMIECKWNNTRKSWIYIE